MPSIRAPSSKRTASLLVAVKCRPLTEAEQKQCRHIIQVTDDKSLIVLDPDLSKDYLDLIQNRTKERRYNFDHVFGPGCSNVDVYRNISSTIAGVIQGLNATVFAYGSTGSGKTYTMVGIPKDPGLMVLSLHTIFDLIKKDKTSDIFEVSCTYLEVYNEVIYDLLEKSSGHLELREDPQHGVIVAGLRSIKVQSADRILELLNLGNSRRKTESTEANATSSRSHAVLEISVKRKQKNQYQSRVLRGRLALVDLAGSERASETNSGGHKLRDGANINKSLLALANCINALGKQQKKGLAYVPYRNSKLTRILKDGLSGNCQTIMVATISPADDQYHHTINTLKYADRAKEIKTQVHKNIGTVDTHVADYQRMIDSLQIEVCRLRKELAEKESQLSTKPAERASDDEHSCLNMLSRETSENVQEHINLQKALFELEETNIRNRTELQRLDDAIAMQEVTSGVEKDGAVVRALRSRRQVILDNIRDNDEAGAAYRKDIQINEKHRNQLQNMIDEAINNNGNKTYLQILSQYRLLGMANTELHFEMAMRDQVIHDQREAIRTLWNLLLGLGLDEQQITDLAAKQGIKIEVSSPRASYLSMKQSPVGYHAKIPPFIHPSSNSQIYPSNACIFQQHQGCSSVAYVRSQTNNPTVCREEHSSSYYSHSHNHSHLFSGLGERGSGRRLSPSFYTPEKTTQDASSFYPAVKSLPSFCSKEQSSSGKDLFNQPKREPWFPCRQNLEGCSVTGSNHQHSYDELASYGGANCGLHDNCRLRHSSTRHPDFVPYDTVGRRTISSINTLNLKWSSKQSPEVASGDGEGEEDDEGQAEDRDQEDRGRRCALHQLLEAPERDLRQGQRPRHPLRRRDRRGRLLPHRQAPLLRQPLCHVHHGLIRLRRPLQDAQRDRRNLPTKADGEGAEPAADGGGQRIRGDQGAAGGPGATPRGGHQGLGVDGQHRRHGPPGALQSDGVSREYQVPRGSPIEGAPEHGRRRQHQRGRRQKRPCAQKRRRLLCTGEPNSRPQRWWWSWRICERDSLQWRRTSRCLQLHEHLDLRASRSIRQSSFHPWRRLP
ncbi:kinesin-like protein KIN-8B isoform X1 [Zingiber officinale]|uniref:kinesin-like protein KIN-8B isoform X1 n=1 Tax=Zingiber officinale TaxID=94328 RepID=UPI001C4ABFA1|nr:kinesin-like protein KIN-8B isoform X1 [Zingiber officinale]XP_042387576.1 kinesin-like protein KIN-8B isoform X1 [Zingiber officinale]